MKGKEFMVDTITVTMFLGTIWFMMYGIIGLQVEVIRYLVLLGVLLGGMFGKAINLFRDIFGIYDKFRCPNCKEVIYKINNYKWYCSECKIQITDIGHEEFEK
jgi:hypothetical protein